MKKGNCRNCGAPPDGSGRCQYCGTRSEIMVMEEALDERPASYIEITADGIRVAVLPAAEDLGRMGRYATEISDGMRL